MLDKERYQIIENFAMPQLGRVRTIRVYLPEGYDESDKNYPVIYMNDGQNLFDSAASFGGDSWEVPDAVDQYFADRDGVIVVGIDNGAEFKGLCRMYEYSPWKMDQNFKLPDWDESVSLSGGEGDKYLDFIVDTLKPYIDDKYKTKTDRENTVIAGSSMGGFISMYGVLKRPDVFSMAGVFSPAFWFNKDEMFAFLNNVELNDSVKIYMDMGTKESSSSGVDFERIYLDGSDQANSILETKSNITLKYVTEEDALHTESAWARRYPDMLKFLFN